MELEIYCEEEVWLGYHTVRVTYNFQDYLDGWSLTSDFTLNVQPEPLQGATVFVMRPYFKLSGVELKHTIVAGEAWKFKLPEYGHEDSDQQVQVQYSTVHMGSLELFASYNSELETIQIRKGVMGSA